MKGKITTALIFFGIMGAIMLGNYFSYYQARKMDQELQRQLDSLRILDKKITTFDSVQSADQKRFLDSLSKLKTLLTHEKVQRAKENQLLRKHNQDMQDRFDRITIPDRPTFFEPGIHLTPGDIRIPGVYTGDTIRWADFITY